MDFKHELHAHYLKALQQAIHFTKGKKVSFRVQDTQECSLSSLPGDLVSWSQLDFHPASLGEDVLVWLGGTGVCRIVSLKIPGPSWEEFPEQPIVGVELPILREFARIRYWAIDTERLRVGSVDDPVPLEVLIAPDAEDFDCRVSRSAEPLATYNEMFGGMWESDYLQCSTGVQHLSGSMWGKDNSPVLAWKVWPVGFDFPVVWLPFFTESSDSEASSYKAAMRLAVLIIHRYLMSLSSKKVIVRGDVRFNTEEAEGVLWGGYVDGLESRRNNICRIQEIVSGNTDSMRRLLEQNRKLRGRLKLERRQLKRSPKAARTFLKRLAVSKTTCLSDFQVVQKVFWKGGILTGQTGRIQLQLPDIEQNRYLDELYDDLFVLGKPDARCDLVEIDPLTVMIFPEDLRVQIDNGDGEKVDGCPHPHVNAHLAPCLGNLGMAIKEARLSADPYALMWAMDRLLATYENQETMPGSTGDPFVYLYRWELRRLLSLKEQALIEMADKSVERIRREPEVIPRLLRLLRWMANTYQVYVVLHGIDFNSGETRCGRLSLADLDESGFPIVFYQEEGEEPFSRVSFYGGLTVFSRITFSASLASMYVQGFEGGIFEGLSCVDGMPLLGMLLRNLDFVPAAPCLVPEGRPVFHPDLGYGRVVKNHEVLCDDGDTSSWGFLSGVSFQGFQGGHDLNGLLKGCEAKSGWWLFEAKQASSSLDNRNWLYSASSAVRLPRGTRVVHARFGNGEVISNCAAIDDRSLQPVVQVEYPGSQTYLHGGQYTHHSSDVSCSGGLCDVDHCYAVECLTVHSLQRPFGKFRENEDIVWHPVWGWGRVDFAQDKTVVVAFVDPPISAGLTPPGWRRSFSGGKSEHSKKTPCVHETSCESVRCLQLVQDTALRSLVEELALARECAECSTFSNRGRMEAWVGEVRGLLEMYAKRVAGHYAVTGELPVVVSFSFPEVSEDMSRENRRWYSRIREEHSNREKALVAAPVSPVSGVVVPVSPVFGVVDPISPVSGVVAPISPMGVAPSSGTPAVASSMSMLLGWGKFSEGEFEDNSEDEDNSEGEFEDNSEDEDGWDGDIASP